MKQDEHFSDVDWKMLGEYLPEKLLEELDEEQNITIHQQLITSSEQSAEPSSTITDQQFLTTSNNPIISTENDVIVSLKDNDEKRRQNIRNELVVRFLTAMSIDYEKQWYLGMIRRRTLDILIKSVEQAKQNAHLNYIGNFLLNIFDCHFYC
jgi:hypothetical protein